MILWLNQAKAKFTVKRYQSFWVMLIILIPTDRECFHTEPLDLWHENYRNELFSYSESKKEGRQINI